VSFEGFAAQGLDEAATENALRASVTLAREGADGTAASAPLVAASVGPYGAILADGSEYRGNYGLSHDELVSFHRRRIAILLDAGPDLLAIETVPSLDEARALAEVLADLPDARAWFTFTCADRATLAGGSSFAEAIALVASSPQVIAVGVNCTPPTYVEELLRVARRVTDKPLVAYPNRGGDWDPSAKRWLGAEGEGLADLAPSWLEAGASLIGGCCGTDATDIAALSAAVTDRKSGQAP